MRQRGSHAPRPSTAIHEWRLGLATYLEKNGPCSTPELARTFGKLPYNAAHKRGLLFRLERLELMDVVTRTRLGRSWLWRVWPGWQRTLLAAPAQSVRAAVAEVTPEPEPAPAPVLVQRVPSNWFTAAPYQPEPVHVARAGSLAFMQIPSLGDRC